MKRKDKPLVPNLDVVDIREEPGSFCLADVMTAKAPASDNNAWDGLVMLKRVQSWQTQVQYVQYM